MRTLFEIIVMQLLLRHWWQTLLVLVMVVVAVPWSVVTKRNEHEGSSLRASPVICAEPSTVGESTSPGMAAMNAELAALISGVRREVKRGHRGTIADVDPH